MRAFLEVRWLLMLGSSCSTLTCMTRTAELPGAPGHQGMDEQLDKLKGQQLRVFG